MALLSPTCFTCSEVSVFRSLNNLVQNYDLPKQITSDMRDATKKVSLKSKEEH